MKRDFLTLAELTPVELGLVLRLSKRFKQSRKRMVPLSLLKTKTVALIFQKHSTRTRVSFEVAVAELGGKPLSLTMNELQLGRGETIEDTAKVLSRYVHAIMARVNDHKDIAGLARAASVPVINGLSNRFHPVQVLADLFTLQERRGKLSGLKVAWVGDGNNVCNSWLYGAAFSGIDLWVATPPEYGPDASVARETAAVASANGGSINLVHDPIEAVRDADCVMTDTFVSMGFEGEREKRLAAFIPRFRIDEALMSHAKKDAIFEHCLPAHRGEEVASGVIDGPQSAVFDQAENRLHTTKALLCLLMLGGRARTIARSL